MEIAGDKLATYGESWLYQLIGHRPACSSLCVRVCGCVHFCELFLFEQADLGTCFLVRACIREIGRAHV